ncbi:hypothetical protein JCM21714_2702 [Gracilibacillus boraciitolerans JCM 21714]|uniref:Uncharacterized protein n=1 Tax=Gracilibacillus boraciitolerans JCM 21714 TaxID=1298598 RepID=W4VLF5_9BACI|nr:hypothetical protein [Gracilibacillus boraciitolerans]GAE93604.1 hypothetical protein JCM21714_2702 [Gracilibacillus boraciitolerans JCM 21714]
MNNKIIKSIIIGTISGSVLGGLLWLIEESTGEKVYTLLLNVDFIFKDKLLPIWLEWFFHLFISWVIVYIFLVIQSIWKALSIQLLFILCLSLIAASSYFPLTILAIKETPSITNIEAIFIGLSSIFYMVFQCIG